MLPSLRIKPSNLFSVSCNNLQGAATRAVPEVRRQRLKCFNMTSDTNISCRLFDELQRFLNEINSDIITFVIFTVYKKRNFREFWVKSLTKRFKV